MLKRLLNIQRDDPAGMLARIVTIVDRVTGGPGALYWLQDAESLGVMVNTAADTRADPVDQAELADRARWRPAHTRWTRRPSSRRKRPSACAGA